MSGYYGYSMSNNAISAYENGEKPLSKWTRSAILNHIAGLILDGELPEEIVSEVDKMKTADLRQFLSASSWHHTSSHYNRTTFYSVNADRILIYFGYSECVCATLSDGSSVYGFYSGKRDPITWKYQEFTTLSGQTINADDIANTRIGFYKSIGQE